jgi:hypothetical protein
MVLFGFWSRLHVREKHFLFLCSLILYNVSLCVLKESFLFGRPRMFGSLQIEALLIILAAIKSWSLRSVYSCYK